jgi:hypothetical protein
MECSGFLYDFNHIPSYVKAEFIRVVDNLPQLLAGPSDFIAVFMTFNRFTNNFYLALSNACLFLSHLSQF